jgi:G:T/U-mismatch repair DNA glycosylase
VNDFASLFKRHRSIRRVYFNGATAAELYRRHVLPSIELAAPYVAHARLPSTSPAHASMSYEEKLRQWSVICGTRIENPVHSGNRT